LGNDTFIKVSISFYQSLWFLVPVVLSEATGQYSKTVDSPVPAIFIFKMIKQKIPWIFNEYVKIFK